MNPKWGCNIISPTNLIPHSHRLPQEIERQWNLFRVWVITREALSNLPWANQALIRILELGTSWRHTLQSVPVSAIFSILLESKIPTWRRWIPMDRMSIMHLIHQQCWTPQQLYLAILKWPIPEDLVATLERSQLTPTFSSKSTSVWTRSKKFNTGPSSLSLNQCLNR